MYFNWWNLGYAEEQSRFIKKNKICAYIKPGCIAADALDNFFIYKKIKRFCYRGPAKQDEFNNSNKFENKDNIFKVTQKVLQCF